MKKYTVFGILVALFLSSCGGEKETWTCIEDGTVMYSLNSNGTLGSADKGCSCDEIRDYEMRLFGEVDEEALKSDFGC